jgi:hypothetical protein
VEVDIGEEKKDLNLHELVADKLIIRIRICNFQVGGQALVVIFYGLVL